MIRKRRRRRAIDRVVAAPVRDTLRTHRPLQSIPPANLRRTTASSVALPASLALLALPAAAPRLPQTSAAADAAAATTGETTGSIRTHERRALDFLVAAYLREQGYKLAAITFAESAPDSNAEDWEAVGVGYAKPPGILELYRRLWTGGLAAVQETSTFAPRAGITVLRRLCRKPTCRESWRRRQCGPNAHRAARGVAAADNGGASGGTRIVRCGAP